MNTQHDAGTRPTPILPLEFPAMPGATTPRDDVTTALVDPDVIEALKQASSWGLWPGDPAEAPHTFFEYRSASEVQDGELALEPTLTSYYGHEIVAPAGIDIIEIRRLRKVRLVLVTLRRVAPGRTLRVLGWQGDNDTIHLLNPLPGEDEYLGVYHAIVFGKRQRDDVVRDESRAHYLRTIEYGETAVLDVDVADLNPSALRFSPNVMARALKA